MYVEQHFTVINLISGIKTVKMFKAGKNVCLYYIFYAYVFVSAFVIVIFWFLKIPNMSTEKPLDFSFVFPLV